MLNFFNRIKNKINQKTALISLRNDWFHDFDHFRNYTKPVLSKAEIKEASAYYNQYGLKIRPDWHNYYKYMTGTFDARFIPADIMYTVIVPYLNYMPFELAYQDKGIYRRLLSNVKTPKTIVQRIHNYFYLDNWNEPVSEKEALERCFNLNNVIIKPTVDSCQGKGVRLFSSVQGKINGNETVEDLFKQYGENFIIQERVKQHDFFSSLNESSLNTMRILTLHLKDEVIVLSKAIRVGGKGSITDNGYGGGFCTGIEDDGSLKPNGFRLTTGDHIDSLQNGVKLAGLKIPYFDTVIAKAKELALSLPYLRLIGWDFAIDTNGNPVFIEMNTLPGIYIMQLCNGPVFGKYTDDLLKSASSVKYSVNHRMNYTFTRKEF